MKRYVFAITGASGTLVGIRVLRELVGAAEVHLVVSPQSFSIMKEESGIDWSAASEKAAERKIRDFFSTKTLRFWAGDNMHAPFSSGSFRTDGMFVVPCSMKTLSGIANGYAGTLVERAADVTLKEGRPLLLSPREMPFSAIHLENMLKLARLGVRIAPPVLAFYQRPGTIEDMVDFVSGRILDAMGVENDIYKRWEGA